MKKKPQPDGTLCLGYGPDPGEVDRPPVQRGKLTDTAVRTLLNRAKAQDPDVLGRHISDRHVDGLALRVSAGGAASWAVDYTRPTGGRARYTIGPADPDEITLAQARELALSIRDRARRGEDPHFDRIAARKRAEEEKRQAETAAQQAKAGTVAELAAQWLNSREARAWRPATRTSFESLLRLYVLPNLGKIPANDVSKADIRRLLDRAFDRSEIASNRTYGTVRGLWNWALSKDLVTDSPCKGVKCLAKERRRERVYTDAELRAIVQAVKGSAYEDLVMLIARCGTRSHETRSMKWSAVDFDRAVWSIPPENAKSARKHEVPLNAGAMAILERRFERRFEQHGEGEFVFPSQGTTCGICRAVGHLRQPVHAKIKLLSLAAGFPEGAPFRLHDIRRTVANLMLSKLELPTDVVDYGVMGHTPPGLVRTYMPSGIALTKVAVALDAWDRHLTGILEGPKKATVVAISSRRA